MNLHEIINKKSRVDSLEERITRLRSSMEIGTKQLSLTPGKNEVRDKLSDDMAKLDGLQRQLLNELSMLESERIIAEDEIKHLPAREQMVMRMRYIEGLPWRQVARRCHYSEQHCFRIHKAAVSRIRANESC